MHQKAGTWPKPTSLLPGACLGHTCASFCYARVRARRGGAKASGGTELVAGDEGTEDRVRTALISYWGFRRLASGFLGEYYCRQDPTWSPPCMMSRTGFPQRFPTPYPFLRLPPWLSAPASSRRPLELSREHGARGGVQPPAARASCSRSPPHRGGGSLEKAAA